MEFLRSFFQPTRQAGPSYEDFELADKNYTFVYFAANNIRDYGPLNEKIVQAFHKELDSDAGGDSIDTLFNSFKHACAGRNYRRDLYTDAQLLVMERLCRRWRDYDAIFNEFSFLIRPRTGRWLHQITYQDIDDDDKLEANYHENERALNGMEIWMIKRCQKKQ